MKNHYLNLQMDLIFIDIKDLKIDDDNFKEINEIITNKEGYPNTIGSFFIKSKTN